MYKDVVDIIKDVCLRHKGVRTFRYQDKSYNNAQNGYEPFQVYLDSVSFHNLNRTMDVFTSEFNMYILSQPSKDLDDVLNVQNSAFTIAADIVAFMDISKEYEGTLGVWDYSIITVEGYSDDNSAGVRLSLVLRMPNPVSLCDLDDNFNDEPYSGSTSGANISVSIKEAFDELNIQTITLPKTNKKKRCN